MTNSKVSPANTAPLVKRSPAHMGVAGQREAREWRLGVTSVSSEVSLL